MQYSFIIRISLDSVQNTLFKNIRINQAELSKKTHNPFIEVTKEIATRWVNACQMMKHCMGDDAISGDWCDGIIEDVCGGIKVGDGRDGKYFLLQISRSYLSYN